MPSSCFLFVAHPLTRLCHLIAHPLTRLRGEDG